MRQFLPLVSSCVAMRSNASAARSFARADSVHRASMRVFISRTSARSLPRAREANIDTAANVIAAPSANDTPAAADWKRMVIIVCVLRFVLLPCVFRDFVAEFFNHFNEVICVGVVPVGFLR